MAQCFLVADLADLRIPASMMPVAEQATAVTDKVCADLLDAEYADLARHVVAKLARKRPSPLLSGRAATFLFDRSTEPYVSHDDLADAFGLSKSTLGQKAKQIRDMLKMTWGTPEFLRAERIDDNPMIWLIMVDGLLFDARSVSVEIQVEAYLQGVIPYVPDLGREGTAAVMAARLAGYPAMLPPIPDRPAGVATSSTLVPPRACSPRTLATASVSPATSRAAVSSPPGRVSAASRMPNVIAGAASSAVLPPMPQRPRGTPSR
jgi:hypothetical protein